MDIGNNYYAALRPFRCGFVVGIYNKGLTVDKIRLLFEQQVSERTVPMWNRPLFFFSVGLFLDSLNSADMLIVTANQSPEPTQPTQYDIITLKDNTQAESSN